MVPFVFNGNHHGFTIILSVYLYHHNHNYYNERDLGYVLHKNANTHIAVFVGSNDQYVNASGSCNWEESPLIYFHETERAPARDCPLFC